MELVKLEMTPKERKIAYARGEEVVFKCRRDSSSVIWDFHS